MEAVCTSETTIDNHFTWQYIPEDNSEHGNKFLKEHQMMHSKLKTKIGSILSF
jgi:hypothetical protein